MKLPSSLSRRLSPKQRQAKQAENVNKLPTKWFELALIFHSFFSLFFGRSFFLLFFSFHVAFVWHISPSIDPRKLCRCVVIQLNRLWAFEGRTRRLNQLLVKDGGRRRNNKFKNILPEWARDFAWYTTKTTRCRVNKRGVGGKMEFTEFSYNRANIFPTLFVLHLYIHGWRSIYRITYYTKAALSLIKTSLTSTQSSTSN